MSYGLYYKISVQQLQYTPYTSLLLGSLSIRILEVRNWLVTVQERSKEEHNQQPKIPGYESATIVHTITRATIAVCRISSPLGSRLRNGLQEEA